jgi:hypothetical protein
MAKIISNSLEQGLPRSNAKCRNGRKILRYGRKVTEKVKTWFQTWRKILRSLLLKISRKKIVTQSLS